MTRKQAIKMGLENGTNKGYGDLSGVVPELVTSIYNDLEAYLDEAMMKARTWDAHVALQDVKEYLEGKDETTSKHQYP